jgi:hypothetical protein
VKAGQFGSFGKEILEGEYGAMFAGCAHESAGLLLVASSGEGRTAPDCGRTTVYQKKPGRETKAAMRFAGCGTWHVQCRWITGC